MQGNVRQFHVEQGQTPARTDGFVLGRWDARERLVADASDPERTYVAWTLDKGTPCDVRPGQLRSVELRVYCHREDVRDSQPRAAPQVEFLGGITSLAEVETCRYLVEFRTPLICAHPQFRIAEPEIGIFACEPAHAAQ